MQLRGLPRLKRLRNSAANYPPTGTIERVSCRGWIVALALLALALSSAPASAFDGRVGVAAGPEPPSPTQLLITVTTSPVGLQVQVDDVWYTAPYVLSCEPGTPHWVNTTSPQSGGPDTRYVFASWSDGSLLLSHMITCDAAGTLTAAFQTQFRIALDTVPSALVMVLDGISYVSPFTFWCSEGSIHVVSVADPAPGGSTERYRFVSWSDGVVANPRTFVCSGPMSLVALYTEEYLVTIATLPVGRDVQVDGVTHT